mgnify:CR=1 FL=1
MAHDGSGHHLSAAQTGWSATHGLMHARVLTLDVSGRRFTGTETLEAVTPGERKRLDQVLAASPEGVAFAVRFHLHPDVDAAIDMGRQRQFDLAMERAIHGVTTVRVMRGGSVTVNGGPDMRILRSALRSEDERWSRDARESSPSTCDGEVAGAEGV